MNKAMDALHNLIYFGSILLLVNQLNAEDTTVTDIVSFDIQIGGEGVGTIDIGLFGETVPLTVKNFLQLATDGIKTDDGVVKYEGSTFHRVIEEFMIQGGDAVKGDGTGEVSVFGGRFNDENFILGHYGSGWLSMANAGENTNTCQFFITARNTNWLDGKHVVFGKVLRGMWVVRQILNVDVDTEDRDKPKVDVVIVKSSAKKPETPFTVAKVASDWMT